MTQRFYDHQDVLDFVNEEGRWNYAITGRGRDEDGDYWEVECLRMFDLEGQQQLPYDFREPFATEVFDLWYEEVEIRSQDDEMLEEWSIEQFYRKPQPAAAGWPFPTTAQEH